uniref:Uncharacterized protein n=1 Tax=Arundo donax TaxID=35708 RepID=A0A0A9HCG0_ARUDO
MSIDRIHEEEKQFSWLNPRQQGRRRVLDGADGAMVAPVEVVGEPIGGEDGRLVRRSLEEGRRVRAAKAEELEVELSGGEAGELGDTVDGVGVEPQVVPCTAKVGLEHGQPPVGACARRRRGTTC